jgi:hypothetical protein
MEKTKRTWHYVQGPTTFDLVCPHNNSHNITWSEFEDHIWCYDCEQDIEYKPGYAIFPTQLAELLGITFDKFDMTTNTYYKYDSKTNTYNAVETK